MYESEWVMNMSSVKTTSQHQTYGYNSEGYGVLYNLETSMSYVNMYQAHWIYLLFISVTYVVHLKIFCWVWNKLVKTKYKTQYCLHSSYVSILFANDLIKIKLIIVYILSIFYVKSSRMEEVFHICGHKSL